MSRYSQFAMLMLISIASATLAAAQTTQPPTNSADPSAASTPHQREVTHDQMMKDCMKKQHQKDSSMSKEQVKKACEEQLKMQDQPKEE